MNAAGLNLAGKEQSGVHLPGNLRTLYLCLGSNIAPQENLPKALERLAQVLTVLQVSTTWQTPAVGSPGPDFMNAALGVQTALSSEEIKIEIIRPIEAELGRVRTADKNAPRTIDIDILIDGGELVDPGVWSEAHKTLPLAELIPGYRNPDSNLTLAQAAEKMKLTVRATPRPDMKLQ